MTTADAERCIVKFAGAFSYLSNFHPSPFRLHGIMWPTAEHAFQGFKSRDEDEWHEMAAIPTPGGAKQAGRRLDLRPDWELVKKRVMFDVVMAKFSHNPELRGWLCATNSMHLAEGNTWHDQYWGDCHCGRAACSEPGSNYLGKCLMGVRMILGDDRVPHGSAALPACRECANSPEDAARHEFHSQIGTPK